MFDNFDQRISSFDEDEHSRTDPIFYDDNDEAVNFTLS